MDRRLEEVAKAVGGGYCLLQMPLNLALAVRGTVAGDRLGARSPPPPPLCVIFRLVVVSLRGPGQSPVLPFACCVGSLLSVGRCGRCSCWCRFRVRRAQWLVCWGCTGCGRICHLGVLPRPLPMHPWPAVLGADQWGWEKGALGATWWVKTGLATNVHHLRSDQKELSHCRNWFLPNCRCKRREHYRVAHGTGLSPHETPFVHGR